VSRRWRILRQHWPAEIRRGLYERLAVDTETFFGHLSCYVRHSERSRIGQHCGGCCHMGGFFSRSDQYLSSIFARPDFKSTDVFLADSVAQAASLGYRPCHNPIEFFISYRLFMAFEKEKYLITFRQVRILQPILIFLGGRFILIIQLLRLRAKAKREIKQAEIEAEEGEVAEGQYSQYGSTNLPLLSSEGWRALDIRQIAGFQAIDAAKATFIKLNLYYVCYLILVIVLLFVGYQIGRR